MNNLNSTGPGRNWNNNGQYSVNYNHMSPWQQQTNQPPPPRINTQNVYNYHHGQFNFVEYTEHTLKMKQWKRNRSSMCYNIAQPDNHFANQTGSANMVPNVRDNSCNSNNYSNNKGMPAATCDSVGMCHNQAILQDMEGAEFRNGCSNQNLIPVPISTFNRQNIGSPTFERANVAGFVDAYGNNINSHRVNAKTNTAWKINSSKSFNPPVSAIMHLNENSTNSRYCSIDLNQNVNVTCPARVNHKYSQYDDSQTNVPLNNNANIHRQQQTHVPLNNNANIHRQQQTHVPLNNNANIHRQQQTHVPLTNNANINSQQQNAPFHRDEAFAKVNPVYINMGTSADKGTVKGVSKIWAEFATGLLDRSNSRAQNVTNHHTSILKPTLSLGKSPNIRENNHFNVCQSKNQQLTTETESASNDKTSRMPPNNKSINRAVRECDTMIKSQGYHSKTVKPSIVAEKQKSTCTSKEISSKQPNDDNNKCGNGNNIISQGVNSKTNTALKINSAKQFNPQVNAKKHLKENSTNSKYCSTDLNQNVNVNCPARVNHKYSQYDNSQTNVPLNNNANIHCQQQTQVPLNNNANIHRQQQNAPFHSNRDEASFNPVSINKGTLSLGKSTNVRANNHFNVCQNKSQQLTTETESEHNDKTSRMPPNNKSINRAVRECDTMIKPPGCHSKTYKPSIDTEIQKSTCINKEINSTKSNDDNSKCGKSHGTGDSERDSNRFKRHISDKHSLTTNYANAASTPVSVGSLSKQVNMKRATGNGSGLVKVHKHDSDKSMEENIDKKLKTCSEVYRFHEHHKRNVKLEKNKSGKESMDSNTNKQKLTVGKVEKKKVRFSGIVHAVNINGNINMENLDDSENHKKLVDGSRTKTKQYKKIISINQISPLRKQILDNALIIEHPISVKNKAKAASCNDKTKSNLQLNDSKRSSFKGFVIPKKLEPAKFEEQHAFNSISDHVKKIMANEKSDKHRSANHEVKTNETDKIELKMTTVTVKLSGEKDKQRKHDNTKTMSETYADKQTIVKPNNLLKLSSDMCETEKSTMNAKTKIGEGKHNDTDHILEVRNFSEADIDKSQPEKKSATVNKVLDTKEMSSAKQISRKTENNKSITNNKLTTLVNNGYQKKNTINENKDLKMHVAKDKDRNIWKKVPSDNALKIMLNKQEKSCSGENNLPEEHKQTKTEHGYTSNKNKKHVAKCDNTNIKMPRIQEEVSSINKCSDIKTNHKDEVEQTEMYGKDKKTKAKVIDSSTILTKMKNENGKGDKTDQEKKTGLQNVSNNYQIAKAQLKTFVSIDIQYSEDSPAEVVSDTPNVNVDKTADTEQKSNEKLIGDKIADWKEKCIRTNSSNKLQTVVSIDMDNVSSNNPDLADNETEIPKVFSSKQSMQQEKATVMPVPTIKKTKKRGRPRKYPAVVDSLETLVEDLKSEFNEIKKFNDRKDADASKTIMEESKATLKTSEGSNKSRNTLHSGQKKSIEQKLKKDKSKKEPMHDEKQNLNVSQYQKQSSTVHNQLINKYNEGNKHRTETLKQSESKVTIKICKSDVLREPIQRSYEVETREIRTVRKREATVANVTEESAIKHQSIRKNLTAGNQLQGKQKNPEQRTGYRHLKDNLSASRDKRIQESNTKHSKYEVVGSHTGITCNRSIKSKNVTSCNQIDVKSHKQTRTYYSDCMTLNDTEKMHKILNIDMKQCEQMNKKDYRSSGDQNYEGRKDKETCTGNLKYGSKVMRDVLNRNLDNIRDMLSSTLNKQGNSQTPQRSVYTEQMVRKDRNTVIRQSSLEGQCILGNSGIGNNDKNLVCSLERKGKDKNVNNKIEVTHQNEMKSREYVNDLSVTKRSDVKKQLKTSKYPPSPVNLMEKRSLGYVSIDDKRRNVSRNYQVEQPSSIHATAKDHSLPESHSRSHVRVKDHSLPELLKLTRKFSDKEINVCQGKATLAINPEKRLHGNQSDVQDTHVLPYSKKIKVAKNYDHKLEIKPTNAKIEEPTIKKDHSNKKSNHTDHVPLLVDNALKSTATIVHGDRATTTVMLSGKKQGPRKNNSTKTMSEYLNDIKRESIKYKTGNSDLCDKQLVQKSDIPSRSSQRSVDEPTMLQTVCSKQSSELKKIGHQHNVTWPNQTVSNASNNKSNGKDLIWQEIFPVPNTYYKYKSLSANETVYNEQDNLQTIHSNHSAPNPTNLGTDKLLDKMNISNSWNKSSLSSSEQQRCATSDMSVSHKYNTEKEAVHTKYVREHEASRQVWQDQPNITYPSSYLKWREPERHNCTKPTSNPLSSSFKPASTKHQSSVHLNRQLTCTAASSEEKPYFSDKLTSQVHSTVHQNQQCMTTVSNIHSYSYETLHPTLHQRHASMTNQSSQFEGHSTVPDKNITTFEKSQPQKHRSCQEKGCYSLGQLANSIALQPTLKLGSYQNHIEIGSSPSLDCPPTACPPSMPSSSRQLDKQLFNQAVNNSDEFRLDFPFPTTLENTSNNDVSKNNCAFQYWTKVLQSQIDINSQNEPVIYQYAESQKREKDSTKNQGNDLQAKVPSKKSQIAISTEEKKTIETIKAIPVPIKRNDNKVGQSEQEHSLKGALNANSIKTEKVLTVKDKSTASDMLENNILSQTDSLKTGNISQNVKVKETSKEKKCLKISSDNGNDLKACKTVSNEDKTEPFLKPEVQNIPMNSDKEKILAHGMLTKKRPVVVLSPLLLTDEISSMIDDYLGIGANSCWNEDPLGLNPSRSPVPAVHTPFWNIPTPRDIQDTPELIQSHRYTAVDLSPPVLSPSITRPIKPSCVVDETSVKTSPEIVSTDATRASSPRNTRSRGNEKSKSRYPTRGKILPTRTFYREKDLFESADKFLGEDFSKTLSGKRKSIRKIVKSQEVNKTAKNIKASVCVKKTDKDCNNDNKQSDKNLNDNSIKRKDHTDKNVTLNKPVVNESITKVHEQLDTTVVSEKSNNKKNGKFKGCKRKISTELSDNAEALCKKSLKLKLINKIEKKNLDSQWANDKTAKVVEENVVDDKLGSNYVLSNKKQVTNLKNQSINKDKEDKTITVQETVPEREALSKSEEVETSVLVKNGKIAEALPTSLMTQINKNGSKGCKRGRKCKKKRKCVNVVKDSVKDICKNIQTEDVNHEGEKATNTANVVPKDSPLLKKMKTNNNKNDVKPSQDSNKIKVANDHSVKKQDDKKKAMTIPKASTNTMKITITKPNDTNSKLQIKTKSKIKTNANKPKTVVNSSKHSQVLQEEPSNRDIEASKAVKVDAVLPVKPKRKYNKKKPGVTLANITPPTCAVCGQISINKTMLSVHMSTRHPYRCHRCRIDFPSKEAKSEHWWSHVSQIFYCYTCNSKYNSNYGLQKHLKSKDHTIREKMYAAQSEEATSAVQTIQNTTNSQERIWSSANSDWNSSVENSSFGNASQSIDNMSTQWNTNCQSFQDQTVYQNYSHSSYNQTQSYSTWANQSTDPQDINSMSYDQSNETQFIIEIENVEKWNLQKSDQNVSPTTFYNNLNFGSPQVNYNVGMLPDQSFEFQAPFPQQANVQAGNNNPNNTLGLDMLANACLMANTNFEPGYSSTTEPNGQPWPESSSVTVIVKDESCAQLSVSNTQTEQLANVQCVEGEKSVDRPKTYTIMEAVDPAILDNDADTTALCRIANSFSLASFCHDRPGQC